VMGIHAFLDDGQPQSSALAWTHIVGAVERLSLLATAHRALASAQAVRDGECGRTHAQTLVSDIRCPQIGATL
jgi:hypothetical protein